VRVLLDENLPHRLRHALAGHEVMTVAFRGWSGVKNGELLKLAEADGFDVLLTADGNLTYQQNLSGRSIALVGLTALVWEMILPHLPEIVAAVEAAAPGSFRVVECGRFRRE
jgi:DMSO/TMAO reductase YedYZ molybdopterin-dependent catalytic subunit